MNRRPTLSDVAVRAGVSAKTASRALNGERHVSSETAARVLAAAEDLQFMPNRLAQDVQLHRAGSHAVIEAARARPR